MTDVDSLCKILLTPKKDIDGDRAKAAQSLAEHLVDIQGFNALYSICVYPDIFAIEDKILQFAGESIGKIISTRDISDKKTREYRALDPKNLDGFHSDALHSALSVFTADQLQRIRTYTFNTPSCSHSLTKYFYWIALDNAFELHGKNSFQAQRAALDAVRLFLRFKEDENPHLLYFYEIAIRIIMGESQLNIVRHCHSVAKLLSEYEFPETLFDRYSFLHIQVLTQLISGDYALLDERNAKLAKLINQHFKEDLPYIDLLNYISTGNLQKASQAMENLRQQWKTNTKEVLFYKSLSIVVAWFIKRRQTFR